jgi:hypothetical protein
MDTFDFEAQLARYAADTDVDVAILFVQWLEDLVEARLDSVSGLEDYQIPHGDFARRVFHLLHWPPKTQSSKPFSSFDFGNQSVILVSKTFPEAKDKRFFHDYFCKRTWMYNDAEARKSDEEIYENDELHFKTQQICSAMLERSEAEVIVIWGGASRRWFEDKYAVEAREQKYRIVTDVQVGTTEVGASNDLLAHWTSTDRSQRLVVCLPHPEYIRRWASQDVLDQVSGILDELNLAYDIPVDHSGLERALRSHPDLDRKFGSEEIHLDKPDAEEMAARDKYLHNYRTTLQKVIVEHRNQHPGTVMPSDTYFRNKTLKLLMDTEPTAKALLESRNGKASTDGKVKRQIQRDAINAGDSLTIAKVNASQVRKQERLSARREEDLVSLDRLVYVSLSHAYKNLRFGWASKLMQSSNGRAVLEHTFSFGSTHTKIIRILAMHRSTNGRRTAE